MRLHITPRLEVKSSFSSTKVEKLIYQSEAFATTWLLNILTALKVTSDQKIVGNGF